MNRFITNIFLVLTNCFHSHSYDLGTWNVLHLKYNHSNKLSVFAETQLRSLRFYEHFHYYEYKGGFNYQIEKNVIFTLGLGSYQTYKEGGDFVLPKNNDEFRIWPQLTLIQRIGNLKIEQRYRSESRFTSSGYRNRFRYRLGVSYGFGKKRSDFNPYQVSMSNELFFTDKEPYFERNRIQFAFQYKPSKNTAVQLGYLHQFDYKINDETGRDFLQIAYFIEL
ncbi:MAG: DUF2490 domain-containing protein [Bacteroidia bacterium]